MTGWATRYGSRLSRPGSISATAARARPARRLAGRGATGTSRWTRTSAPRSRSATTRSTSRRSLRIVEPSRTAATLRKPSCCKAVTSHGRQLIQGRTTHGSLAGLLALLVAGLLASPARAQPSPAPPTVIDGPSAAITSLGGLSVARDGTGGVVYL